MGRGSSSGSCREEDQRTVDVSSNHRTSLPRRRVTERGWCFQQSVCAFVLIILSARGCPCGPTGLPKAYPGASQLPGCQWQQGYKTGKARALPPPWSRSCWGRSAVLFMHTDEAGCYTVVTAGVWHGRRVHSSVRGSGEL